LKQIKMYNTEIGVIILTLWTILLLEGTMF
jgi:hypothetical protein